MKKIITAIVLLITLAGTAQSKVKMNPDDLIGYWEPNQQSVHMVIWKDVNGEYQVMQFSTDSGKPLEILEFTLYYDAVVIRTLFVSTDWSTKQVFRFVDRDTLQCELTGDGEGLLTFTRGK
jgi:hypothetical protein